MEGAAGIQDQIVDGESGILISHPRNQAEFGAAVAGLLSDHDRARRTGQAAHIRVRDHFSARITWAATSS